MEYLELGICVHSRLLQLVVMLVRSGKYNEYIDL